MFVITKQQLILYNELNPLNMFINLPKMFLNPHKKS